MHSGTIAPRLSDTLWLLNLYNNSLSGTLSPGLSVLTRLESPNVYSNAISGTIPSVLAKLTTFIYFNLNGNHLSGQIPPELSTENPHLKAINLFANSLSGTMSSSGHNAKLEYLAVQSNYLSGSIPLWLTLRYQLLSDNKVAS